MRKQSIAHVALLVLLGLTPVAHAEPRINVQVEVSYLLGYVEGAGCAFYRNGTWYDSTMAQAHLRDKYKYLAARSLINTTEDFIERAATESSLTGEAYQVKCGGNAVITSSAWLRSELSHLRAFQ